MGRIAAVATIVSALAACGIARAQSLEPERNAAARALFEQGMQAVDGHDWATAADRLRRSYELRASPVVRYNLALALAELGRLVEASEHLRAVSREAEEGSDAHRLAAGRLEAILPRLGQLRVHVTGAAGTVEIRLDGRPLAAALVGVAQPADPGAHRVTLHRDGSELAAREVTVASGELATVSLEAPEPATPEPVAAPPTPAHVTPEATTRAPDRDAARGGGVESEAWLWILVAVLAAGAGAGIATALALSAEPPPYVHGDSGALHPALVGAW